MPNRPTSEPAVFSPRYCSEQAELCDLFAAEAADPRLSSEWRLMAQEWRMASTHDQDRPPAEARSA